MLKPLGALGPSRYDINDDYFYRQTLNGDRVVFEYREGRKIPTKIIERTPL